MAAPNEYASIETADRGPQGAGGDRPPRRRWRAIVGLFVVVLGIGAAVSAPWWGPRALGRLAFFRVRRVAFDGVRYAAPAELLRRLGVDTTVSIWTDLDRPTARLRGHPLVGDVRIERRLPATLRVSITEKVPVALVPERGTMAAYDAAGVRLPIDPNRVGGLDVPIVGARDTALFRLLGALLVEAPRLYARVSEARRETAAARAGGDDGRAEVVLALTSSPARRGTDPDGVARTGGTMPVRAMSDVTPARLGDLLLVESDLARRRARVAELDLRYRDQVIARLQ